LPVASFEAAKIGQDPSVVSPKQPPEQSPSVSQVPTAAFKAVLFAGVNTACATSTINNVAAHKNTTTTEVHE
jgi:hypothetical protein